MVEKRNHLSNKFDDFQVLIEDLRNLSLIPNVMAEQAKVRADQARVKGD